MILTQDSNTLTNLNRANVIQNIIFNPLIISFKISLFLNTQFFEILSVVRTLVIELKYLENYL